MIIALSILGACIFSAWGKIFLRVGSDIGAIDKSTKTDVQIYEGG
jgi:hypothetical protein